MTEKLDILLHWVREREAIRQRKDRGDSFPWTDDPILKAYRFCCVRREDDRVTRWIRTNIREPFAGHEHLWFMLCAARMINWPNTLDMLMGDQEAPQEYLIYPGAWPNHTQFSPKLMGEALEDLKSMNWKVFTGAYIIPAPTTAGQTKGRYVAEVVLGDLWMSREGFTRWFQQPNRTLAGTHQALTSHRSWGPFLAYQAVVDMRFTPLLSGASDVATWCACGPGTIRGLNRLYGRRLSAVPHRDQLLNEIRALYPLIQRSTGVAVDFSDVPNVLCEFDKYERVKNGEGTPRARYVPGRGY